MKIKSIPSSLITTNVIIVMGLFYYSCENTITNNSDILDCDNIPNGSASVDDCGLCTRGTTIFEFNYLMDCGGVCGGSALEDCAGICNGSAVLDECDVCGGDGIVDGACDCEGNFPLTYYIDNDGDGDGYGSGHDFCDNPGAGWSLNSFDIDDVCGGVIDDCGKCDGHNADQDCLSECFGNAILDNCEICDDDVSNDCIQDCFGEWGGSAVEDCASICNGTSEEDCAGACNGSAVLNDCGVCGSDNSTGIVINEINYNSSDDYNPEDWVELYNSSESPINIGNWEFRDETNEHVFIIPENTILACDFIVICKDATRFTSLFPEVTNYIGDLGFGLGGGSDMVRLFDTNEILIDEVEYDDEYPWPEEADGEGYTLELIHPSLDNSLAGNWLASLLHYGSPGEINSVYNDK